ncbi:MAG: Uma2 family endonuclease [Nitrospirae bacterium]|nr:Uma2 family endonuclease [Nitrospirota bacterium]
MTIQPHPIKLTYEDYLLFPDDGKRHELIDGDHYMTPAPTIRHQRISGNLHRILSAFARQHRLGQVLAAPCDVLLSDVDVVEPDLLFVSTARQSLLTETHVAGAPDLVVEVLSERTRKVDERIKLRLYERHGVAEYWIVDPDLETLKVHRLMGQGYVRAAELSKDHHDTLSTPFFPDLTLLLTEIFE